MGWSSDMIDKIIILVDDTGKGSNNEKKRGGRPI